MHVYVFVYIMYVYYVCVHVNILGRIYKTGIILATCEYSSWGSQGKNAEVICHSLLQWTTFCQNVSIVMSFKK